MNAAPPTRGSPHHRPGTTVVVALGALPLLVAWLLAAWVGEDAYITLRAVDNLLAGDGLRWNPDERVQVFSHPLWLFAVAPLFAATGSAEWSFTLLGLACSLGAWAVLARALRVTPAGAAALLLAWLASASLVRFGTSGFENPLTHLLLACQVANVLAVRHGRAPDWGRLCLVAALAGVNRLDSLALHAPALAAVLVAAPEHFSWRRALAGLAPLFAWIAFALVYFGFALPNPGYAKLPPGVPAGVQLGNGLGYLADFVTQDFASAVLVAVAGVVGALAARHGWRSRDAFALGLAGLAAGAWLYAGLVVAGGGDFVLGRHFTGPTFAALCVCAAGAAVAAPRWRAATPPRRRQLATAALCALVALVGASLLLGRAREPRALERSAAHLRLTTAGFEATARARSFRATGLDAERRAREAGAPAAVLDVIGLATREIGRDVVLIDSFALADPLLARLPPDEPETFRPGHARRSLPTGYLRARLGGDASRMDPDLANYYVHLRHVVSGPLFSVERWRDIVAFHLGAYDPLRDAYSARAGPPAPAP